MMTAAHGSTTAQPAVMETRPARMPLFASLMLNFPVLPKALFC